MRIVLEAEVMDQQKGPMSTPNMYLPGHCRVRLRVVLGHGGGGFGPYGAANQEFNQEVILRLDEVSSIFDLLMKNLSRNMREMLVRHLEDKSYLEKFPLMPVLTFERIRG